jgi:hypothetical protein
MRPVAVTSVRLALVGLATAIVQGTMPAQSSSPRMAAVEFALRNGFDIPRANLVVALEVRYGGVSDIPRTATDRSTTLPPEVVLRDAREIAALLGPDVTVKSALPLVLCPQRRCYAAADVPVLVVDELKNDEPGIYVKLYLPAQAEAQALLRHAIVDVEQTPAGWTATRFRRVPTTVVAR